MKSKWLLIPSMVAIAATPFIGLTSCFETEGGGDKPEPTPPEPEHETVFNLEKYIKGKWTYFNEFVFYHSDVNLSANTWYEVNIDTSAHASDLVNTDRWECGIGKMLQLNNYMLDIPIITQADVWIDGNKLQYVEKDFEDLESNEFTIMTRTIETEVIDSFIQGKQVLGGPHVAKIQFQIDRNVSAMDLCFSIKSPNPVTLS